MEEVGGVGGEGLTGDAIEVWFGGDGGGGCAVGDDLGDRGLGEGKGCEGEEGYDARWNGHGLDRNLRQGFYASVWRS